MADQKWKAASRWRDGLARYLRSTRSVLFCGLNLSTAGAQMSFWKRLAGGAWGHHVQVWG
ncbi:MAG: hypothetical protein CBB79_01060 [Synechococcus sp. TMED19]|nr:MAG: hypothetical protein CBB79_01060 [Synechococcus sp. TMED19]